MFLRGCIRLAGGAGQRAVSSLYPNTVRSVRFSSAGRAVCPTTFPFLVTSLVIKKTFQCLCKKKKNCRREGKKLRGQHIFFNDAIYILRFWEYSLLRAAQCVCVCLFIKYFRQPVAIWAQKLVTPQYFHVRRLRGAAQRTNPNKLGRTKWQQQPPEVTFPQQQISTQICFWGLVQLGLFNPYSPITPAPPRPIARDQWLKTACVRFISMCLWLVFAVFVAAVAQALWLCLSFFWQRVVWILTT